MGCILSTERPPRPAVARKQQSVDVRGLSEHDAKKRVEKVIEAALQRHDGGVRIVVGTGDSLDPSLQLAVMRLLRRRKFSAVPEANDTGAVIVQL